jgi:pimeloyl-ACP methyl ester carboxylesterase
MRLKRDVKRLIAPDFPGHGFSRATSTRLTPDALREAMASTLNELVEEPAVLVGNSLGGALALHYAITHPARVRALVLVSPAAAPSSDEQWQSLRASFAVDSRADARAFVRRLYHRTPWFMPFFAHEFPAALARPAVRDLLASATNDDLPPADALGALLMPVLLLWGRSERLLPESHFEYLSTHLPKHAVIERPEGFGHCPHFDAPGELANRIVAFTRTVVARSN